jgi:hypothetical protein
MWVREQLPTVAVVTPLVPGLQFTGVPDAELAVWPSEAAPDVPVIGFGNSPRRGTPLFWNALLPELA